ncbi:uncharacterized protein [Nicotiana sylvestris]|uniref:uncharacterized protein n=1 Tax=Nicotiana sylvestris TaxID=4096 RepID=UPI00388CBEA2
MEIRTERIRPNNVYVRAFDGVKMDAIREIDLILTIGPMDFEVTFQVLDMDTSYNFLLRRPWIHTAGAIPSTLHQMVKCEHEYQEIVVYGEDEKSIYRDPSVPCLESREGSEHIVYQDFEIVVADQCEEGTPCPQPFLSNASIMVSSEMIKHDYKPGKGLGASLQGIVEPITLTASENFFGVGFRATEADVKWANKCKNDGCVLPQPVPYLAKTFVNPSYIEEEKEAFMAEEIEDICEAMRSYNADLNNMTCLRTSCLDPNTLSNFEIMNQEPEYDEGSDGRRRRKKMAFTTPWGNYCYRVMPFGLKNTETTYMRAMTAIFHDIMHQEIEVYVDDVIIKSRTQDDHVRDLKKFFVRLCKYDLKLNPAKCAFGVPSGKLLWFIVSQRGIELDLTKIKFIRDLPPPRTKKEKDVVIRWTDECQDAFDKIKEYLSNPPVLVPLEPGRPLFLLDSLKYIFQKPMPTGRFAKWKILLTEFDIVYVTHMAMKAQALADQLAENPIDDVYHPLSTYFLDEEVNSV